MLVTKYNMKGSCSRSPSINITLIFQAPLPTMKLLLQHFVFYICSRQKSLFIKPEHVWLGIVSSVQILREHFKEYIPHVLSFILHYKDKTALKQNPWNFKKIHLEFLLLSPPPNQKSKDITNILRLHWRLRLLMQEDSQTCV